MKKHIFLFIFLLSSSIYAQGVFFKMGKNYSSFSYKNNTSFADKIKINGTGSSYELGYAMPLKFKDFSYLASITLNDYNGTTNTPAVKLHVKSNGPTFRLEGTNHTYMEFYPQGVATRFGWIGYPSANSVDLIVSNENVSGALIINTNNTERFRINAAGSVGIGTTTPSAKLHVNGDIVANSIAGTSDARYKINIRPIVNPLEKVKALQGGLL